MDFPRLSSPPSIHIHDFNNYDRHRPAVVPPSDTMSGQPFSSSGPMRIPTKNVEHFAPPPLPPPPRINDLENGHDAGWIHANSKGGIGKLAPINPSSSLFGGHSRPEPIHRSERMTLDELGGRSRALPVSRSPETQIRIEPPQSTDEGFRNSISTNLSEPILKGEQDFSRKSVKDSSDAYDQHLLSKIGKPHSPPRQSLSLGSDSRSPITTLPFHSRNTGSLHSPGATDGAPGTLDLRWYNSPQSGGISPGISPGTKTGWKDYINYRSPSVESSAPSSAVDFEHSAYAREASRRFGGGTTPQFEDNFSFTSRSNRGSYDQGIFSDVEGDFPSDDSGNLRQLHVGNRTPPYLDALSTQSKQQGMKRRASSPPREPMSDDRYALHTATSNGDLGQRRTTGHPFTSTASPNSRYPPSHGSLSSASSASLRTGSYASSASLSLGGSSMTSVSSYDRHSPGGLSPSSDLEQYHEKSILNPSPPGSLATHSAARSPSFAVPSEPKTTASARKMSVQTALNTSKPGGPRIGGMYICDCCPKKPKKFDSPEELRAHEMEKQYSCQFCNNRFKNKNEAERHQNSLHLRRHSWSCAALSGYQAAFHPSSSPAAQSSAGPTHDTCGYCGDEFPNFPQPDWDRRFEHLTTVHKFGECNNAKKFYRADHFRQHLKHSHAGTSGKWTNILENACMKDEPQSEVRLANVNEQGGRVPVSTSGGGGAGSTMPSTTGTLTSNTINEVLDES